MIINGSTYFTLITSEILGYNVEQLRPSFDVCFIFLSKMLIEHLLSILLINILHITYAKSLTEKFLRINWLERWLYCVRAIDGQSTGSSSVFQVDKLLGTHGLPIDRFTDNWWW